MSTDADKLGWILALGLLALQALIVWSAATYFNRQDKEMKHDRTR